MEAAVTTRFGPPEGRVTDDEGGISVRYGPATWSVVPVPTLGVRYQATVDA